MIIACPACKTRYAVPDSAIGEEGRVVRCAKCRHSWFQDGPEASAPAPQAPAPQASPGAPPVAAPAPSDAATADIIRQLREELLRSAPERHTPEQAAPTGDRPSPPAPRVAAGSGQGSAAALPEAAPAVAQSPLPEVAPHEPPREVMPWLHSPSDLPSSDPLDAEQDGEQDYPSRFAYHPPFRPRRNPARLWTIAVVIFALVAFGAMGVVAKYGLPQWAPLSRSTFAAGPSDLTLDFPPNRQDRRTLPNGTEYFGVSGRITNVGKERRVVPTLLIVLRDEHNRIVYSWEVTPPKGVLAPGESMPVIEAVTDIPRAAKFAEIGWKRA